MKRVRRRLSCFQSLSASKQVAHKSRPSHQILSGLVCFLLTYLHKPKAFRIPVVIRDQRCALYLSEVPEDSGKVLRAGVKQDGERKPRARRWEHTRETRKQSKRPRYSVKVTTFSKLALSYIQYLRWCVVGDMFRALEKIRRQKERTLLSLVTACTVSSLDE